METSLLEREEKEKGAPGYEVDLALAAETHRGGTRMGSSIWLNSN